VKQSEISDLYFFKEDEDGGEMVTEEEERVFWGGLNRDKLIYEMLTFWRVGFIWH